MAFPQPGQQLDTFKLEEAIGAGGMGAVFLAFDTRLHRMVALKILPPEQSDDPEVLRRFYQEGQAAAQLDQENIARVYTIGSDQGLHYIAFEYIEGTTIRQRVEAHGPLPIEEAINYTLQIATALVHASERGVVHRDIKPSNIIVTPQGRAKLVDMGLARRFERGGDHGLTQSGMTLGTFDYISPEQARDPRNVDVRSDLYSLGCTLFHMLTGRPPFPDGTVLQKLLQHQEDAPPDVRSLNPGVPSDLAVILVKLMAKDRDRRYQSPEQLVRDLLTVAGALGLRSISPEGLVWMAATQRPAWERHLVWGLPSAALILIVGTLVLWGQTGEGTTPADNPEPPLTLAAAPPTEASTGAKKTVAATKNSRVSIPAAPKGGPVSAPDPSPAWISVGAADDLARIVADAPAGSTVVLAEDGPYDLRSGTADGAPPLAIRDRNLTIKAATGVRPVLRLARRSGSREGPVVPALCQIQGGRVVLEGLEFLLDPGDREEPLDAVWAEDADLSLRRCRFHRPGSRASGARVAAVHVRATGKAGSGTDRTAPVVLDACQILGGQVGLLAEGPVDVSLRDVTIGAAEPAISFDNSAGSPVLLPAIHMSHVSIIAGDGPVFRFAGEGFRVRIDDSVVAPPREGEVTLVAAREPDGLDWLGRGNLYARVGTYLLPTHGALGRAPISRYKLWADATSGPREIDSIASNAFVWAESDPLQTLAQDDPSRAFLLGPSQRPSLGVGARRGPLGPLSPGTEMLVAAVSVPVRPSRTARTVEPETTTSRASKSAEPSPPEVKPAPAAAPEDPMPVGTTALTRVDDDTELPAMPPMVTPETEPGNGERVATAPEGDPAKETTPREPLPSERAAVAPIPGARADTAEGPIRTKQHWLDALRALGPKGGTLRLAADADLELGECEILGSGRWVIQAEQGPGRPRIRFQPAASDSRRATGWPVLFRVRSGALHLQGIDLVLEQAQAPNGGRWAAFGTYAGTELSLTDCTVTVAGRHPRSAVQAVLPGERDPEPGGAAADPSAASVRVTDCLLRSGGDLIDVAGGRRLDLEITNSVVATEGSLVHGHGSPRVPTADSVKIVLRQVTALDAGGLVHLESAVGEPELPLADVVARDSIFVTAPQGVPLFRVDGQDGIDANRDRVRWEGHGVAYHQISTYRRDQTTQLGTLPVSYDRPSWEVAVAPRDEAPVHGDLKFATEPDPDRSPWSLTAEDIRLAPDSPAHSAGPDLQRIPTPARIPRSPE